MYLSKPCPELQPWYGQRDLRSGSSKKRSEDQVLEDTFKDSELKRTHDPLVSVEWFLKKKQQAPDKRSRWEETPRVEDRDRGPPILKARSKRGEMPAWKKAAEEQSAPPPPPPSASTSNTSSKTQSLESSTKSRENSERARAQALKAEARRRRDASSSVASTPASEGGYHSGYNKHVTKGLHRERGHGWKNARWDDR